MFASGFSWFRLIPAIDQDVAIKAANLDEHTLVKAGLLEHGTVPETHVYLHAWLAALLLLGLALLARRGLEAARQRTGVSRYFSDEKPTMLTMAEVFVGGIQGMMADMLDRKTARTFFPLIAGLFAYILFCNLQGLIPGFLPPTDNINTNVGMAIIVFLTFNGVGLWLDAAGYIKHLMGPALLLAPLMLPIEVISLIIRPLSLTVRLTANMYGDHQVFTVISDLVPILLPVALLMLALVVSVIQSFVFSLLSVIYIHLAMPHHEHEEGHGGHGAHDHGGAEPAVAHH